jgi:predicted ATPase
LGSDGSAVRWNASLCAGVPLADLDGFPFVERAREQLTGSRIDSVQLYAERLLGAGDARSAHQVMTALLEAEPQAGERSILLAAEASARLGRSAEALRLLDGLPPSETPALGTGDLGERRQTSHRAPRPRSAGGAERARTGLAGVDEQLCRVPSPRGSNGREAVHADGARADGARVDGARRAVRAAPATSSIRLPRFSRDPITDPVRQPAPAQFDSTTGFPGGARGHSGSRLDVEALREAIVRFDPAVSPARSSKRVVRRGMPLPVSSFIGRGEELEAIAAARRTARLITLVGPGGVGKTRLAIESARRVDHPEDDEQWMLELAPLRHADHLLEALTHRIGAAPLLPLPETMRHPADQTDATSSSVSAQPADAAVIPGSTAQQVGGDTIDAIARHLAGRRTLLLLDNAEHLRREVAALAVELLGQCPGLTVLVTTREALRVPGEKLVPVAPMSIHDSGDAVALFSARAADAAPGFDAGDDVQRCIRDICARLDGLPLALELAAARLDALELDELRRSIEADGMMHDANDDDPNAGGPLGEAADLGGGGTDGASGTRAGDGRGDGRGLRYRHASLRSTIGWSVDLLTPPERLLLRELAWFAGPFSLEAVDAVCRLHAEPDRRTDSRAGAPGQRPRDLLLALARKSLVAVDSVAGRRVYRLLESVKNYLRDSETRTPAPVETTAPVRSAPASAAHSAPAPAAHSPHSAWLRRHLAHHSTWVARVDTTLRGPAAQEGHALLDAARPDLQLASATAFAVGDRESALLLAGAQAWHWFRRGQFTRARTDIDDALALPGPAEPSTVARAYFGAVMNIHRAGDEFGGERYAFEGADAAERSGDPTLRALFAACTGMWRATAGDMTGHDERMQRALALLEHAEPWAVSEVHIFRGIAKGYLDQPAQALEAFAEAHRAAKACGHRWAADAAAQRLAHLYIKLRRGHDAVAHVRAAVHGAVSDGDMHAVVTTLHTGAAACALLERHSEGAALLGVVDTVAVRFGYDKQSIEPPYWSSYRDRVRQGLPAAVWKREYTRGTRLGIGDAIRLIDQLAS